MGHLNCHFGILSSFLNTDFKLGHTRSWFLIYSQVLCHALSSVVAIIVAKYSRCEGCETRSKARRYILKTLSMDVWLFCKDVSQNCHEILPSCGPDGEI